MLRLAPPVLVGATFVYLGYHWLTDILAGLLLGVFLGRVLARLDGAPGHGAPGHGAPGHGATGNPAERNALPSSVTTPDS